MGLRKFCINGSQKPGRKRHALGYPKQSTNLYNSPAIFQYSDHKSEHPLNCGSCIMFALAREVAHGNLGKVSKTYRTKGRKHTRCTRNVPDPGKTGILQFGLDDLQVSLLDTRSCEVGDFELDANRSFCPLRLSFLDTGQT